MNIVLIGFMGSGKSEVARRLAAELNFSFTDVDEIIEEKTGMSINQIFQKHGEKYFRDIESKVIKSLYEKGLTEYVISTGGGCVLLEENREILKKLGVVFWLDAKPLVIYQRTKDKKVRPLLLVENPLYLIKRLLKAREPFYKETSDFYIDTSELTINQVVNEIIKILKIKKYIPI